MPRVRHGLPTPNLNGQLLIGVVASGQIGNLNISKTSLGSTSVNLGSVFTSGQIGQPTSILPLSNGVRGDPFSAAFSRAFGGQFVFVGLSAQGLIGIAKAKDTKALVGVQSTGSAQGFNNNRTTKLIGVAAQGKAGRMPIALGVQATGHVGTLVRTTTVILTSGTSFTVPAGVTNLKKVEAWGSGGQGGNSWNVAAGGSGGGFSAITNLAVTAGSSISYQIGQGGSNTSTALYSGGDAGTDTWFSSTAILLAKGGSGGGDLPSVNALGGQASAGIGTIKFSGGNGGAAAPSPDFTSGGGGGAAGPDGDGNPGIDAGANSSAGGSGDAGHGGAGGAGKGFLTGAQTGNNGVSNPSGGGGGGACDSTSGTARAGVGGSPGGGGGGNNGTETNSWGNGANGQIRITY